MGKILLREASKSLVKREENELYFLEERTLLDVVSRKSCGKKRGGGGFLYNNLEIKPHLDLEDEAVFIEKMRKKECLE